ncbi:MAG: efflux RND transporter periplasmic adaptor subunit [Planctomycetes bacterium]|nr:efflux RND transporter periplasmic adaptor subunit [Planctomycetota bacterium]
MPGLQLPRLLAAVLFAVACLQTGCDRTSDAAKTASPGAATPEKKEAVPVKTVRPARGPIAAYLASTATLEARRRVDVFAQAAGVLRELAVEEGDRVEEGRLLARLDDDELRLAEEKARVNHQKLEADLARQKSMLEQKLIPPEKYDDVRFQYERSRVEWKEAQLALTRCRILAPITGTVVAREVRFGDLIARNAKLFTISDEASLLCKAYVPEKEMQRLKSGQPVLLASDAAPGKEFRGAVELLSPVVDPTTGTQKIQIAVEDPRHDLRAGMFVSLSILTEVHEAALLVPKKAILYEENRPCVFVAQDGVAVRRPVTLALADKEHAEVTEGVGENDQILVVGQNGLREGVAVRIVE